MSDLGFSYRTSKDGSVAISRDGMVVTRLRGKAAEKFLERVTSNDPQQVMARATGNYKRGNEKNPRA